MTNYMPRALTGQLVPGVVSNMFQFSYVTERPYGLPMKKAVYTPAAPQKPKNLGDSKHQELMGALKNLTSVTQKATQMTDALPGNRDWRG